jgi:serine/threonine-protein kinase
MKVCARGLEPLDDGLITCPEHGSRALSLDRSTDDARVGTRVAERYVITGVIARGGMGVVYAAHHEALERDLALKILDGAEKDDAEFAARFAREAKISAGLRSPHVVEVYDAGRLPGGELYLAMARLAGRSLEAAATESWPIARVLHVATQLARALAAAHAAGVVHRDLKPSNVMVGAEDHTTVIDFGLARRLHADDATLTHAGQLYGTPAYMPPEQWDEAAGEVTPAADVYMLGATLYQLATGRRCFAARSLPGLMQQHLFEPAPSLARWAEQQGLARDARWGALGAVVARCLAKSPSERYADGAAVLAALGSVSDDRALADALATTTRRSVPAAGPSSAPVHVAPATLGARRRPTPRVLLGAGVLLAALTVIVLGARGAWGPPALRVLDARAIGALPGAAVATVTAALGGCRAVVPTPTTLFVFVEPPGRVSGVELRPRGATRASLEACVLEETRGLELDLSSGGSLGIVQLELASE